MPSDGQGRACLRSSGLPVPASNVCACLVGDLVLQLEAHYRVAHKLILQGSHGATGRMGEEEAKPEQK